MRVPVTMNPIHGIPLIVDASLPPRTAVCEYSTRGALLRVHTRDPQDLLIELETGLPGTEWQFRNVVDRFDHTSTPLSDDEFADYVRQLDKLMRPGGSAQCPPTT